MDYLNSEMKKLISISAFILLLTACSIQSKPADDQIDQETSWEEKMISEIIKYEKYPEKNLDLSMEQLMVKKEACVKYAIELYGESIEVRASGAVVQHDHKYSPRFDRCFIKQDYEQSGRNGIDPFSRVSIIDAISETRLFNYNRNCENIFDRTRYTDEEYRDRCPYESDVRLLWDALIQK